MPYEAVQSEKLVYRENRRFLSKWSYHNPREVTNIPIAKLQHGNTEESDLVSKGNKKSPHFNPLQITETAEVIGVPINDQSPVSLGDTPVSI